jgi:hypothetical protein
MNSNLNWIGNKITQLLIEDIEAILEIKVDLNKVAIILHKHRWLVTTIISLKMNSWIKHILY